MAEILEAVLQLEISAFTASLQQAAQQVTAFAQAIQGSVSSSAQAFQQQVQQINQIAEATKRATQTVRDERKTEIAEAIAGKKKQSAAEAEEIKASTALYRYQEEVKQQLFRETLALEVRNAKERQAAEAATIKATEALQRNFFANIMGMEKERVANERRAGAEILAIWKQTNAELFAMQEATQRRAQAGVIATNTLASQNIARITGQGPAAVGLVAQDLFLLQGYIGLLHQATPAASGFENAIARVGTSFRTLAGFAAAGFLIALPFKIFELGKEAVQTAVKMESLNASFAGIAKGAAAGAQALEFVRNMAQRVGTDFLSTADSFKSLTAAAQGTALEGDRIRKIFEQMSITGRVLGLDAGQVQRALLALEQMISKGTISAEELRKQLGNAVPGALNIMARALGVSTEQLNSMMKAGDLLAVEVLPKFGAQLEKEFGPGLERAMRTASASFAKLGNELRDVSAGIGAGIIKVLQPAADFVTNLLQKAREAADRARKEVERVGAEVFAGKPVPIGTSFELPAGSTEEEVAKAMEILERLSIARKNYNRAQQENIYTGELWRRGMLREMATMEEQLLALKKGIEVREDYKKSLENTNQEETEKGISGARQVEAQKNYKKHVEEVLKTIRQLPEEMQKMASKADLLPTIYGKSEEKLRVIKKLIQETDDLIDKTPGLRLDPKIQEAMKGAETLAKIAQGEVDGRKEKERLDKEAIAEDKRRRAQLIAEEKQRAAEEIRLRDEASIQIAKMTLGETEAKLVALDIQTRKMREAKVNETIITDLEASKRTEIYKEEYEKFLQYDKGKFTAISNRIDKQEEIEKLLSVTTAKITKTAVDDFITAQEVKLKKLEELGATEVQMTQFQEDTKLAAARLANEEAVKLQKEANKEQEKNWRELSNSIENTLSSSLYNIFKGTKDLFEGIRDAFLKLLAKLAADALTHAIIIPAIVKLFGGGGGGTAGSALGAFGLAGTGGETGASGSNSGVAQAIGLVTAGNSLSGAFGGPSLGLGTGGFGASLAATEIGRLPFIGSFFGGPGPGAAGPTTASGSITLGTIAGGAGIGIAAGMILSRIMSMLGVGGMANTTVSGAVGGAAAGTFIAPGIGTAIGAIVGALGGALAGLFGGGRKQPGFDIKEMQPGRIRYDDSIGMVVEQDFRILADFHQRLGTDYEDFTAMINDGINDMFQQVLSQIQGAHPDVQRALVDPLNSAFQDIATMIENYPAIGGEKFKEQLETMMQDFGNIFATTSTDALGELIAAVEKIDPVVKAFVTIIEAVHEDIRELQRQQKALDNTLKGNMNALEESLMTSTEILALRRAELSNLVSQFEGGDEATKIALAPQIGELTVAILELSKTVFSSQNSFGNITGIQAAIKSLEESLYTPTQLLAARQADLARLIEQFRSGTAATQTALGPEIAQLALEIMQLSESVYTLAEQQALIADFPAQMRAVTEALFSPAQQYLSQQNQLQALLAQFRAGTPEEQLALEPQIAAMIAQIINLARGTDVLGQDPELLRQVQAQLVAIMQEVQDTIADQVNNQTSDAAELQATLERTQAEMIAVLREVENVMARNIVNAGAQTVQALWSTAGEIISTTYTMSNGMITAQYQTTNGMVTAQYNAAGQLISTEYYIGGALQGSINNVADTDASWSSALYQIQAELIQQVASVRDAAWYSYTQLEDALWKEIELAEEQIRLLVNSLYHLETVDQVVRDALGVLGAMNARLGNPLRVDMEGSLGEQLQRDSLQTANNLLRSQQNANRAVIGLLGKVAYGLSWQAGLDLGSQYTGYQHGGYIPRNMAAMLHAGEQVIPEWENRAGGGAKTISINVYGGSKDPAQIADAVLKVIEQKAGRLHESKLQVARR